MRNWWATVANDYHKEFSITHTNLECKIQAQCEKCLKQLIRSGNEEIDTQYATAINDWLEVWKRLKNGKESVIKIKKIRAAAVTEKRQKKDVTAKALTGIQQPIIKTDSEADEKANEFNEKTEKKAEKEIKKKNDTEAFLNVPKSTLLQS